MYGTWYSARRVPSALAPLLLQSHGPQVPHRKSTYRGASRVQQKVTKCKECHRPELRKCDELSVENSCCRFTARGFQGLSGYRGRVTCSSAWRPWRAVPVQHASVVATCLSHARFCTTAAASLQRLGQSPTTDSRQHYGATTLVRIPEAGQHREQE